MGKKRLSLKFLAARGTHLRDTDARHVYVPGTLCPRCGAASFHVGRITATCARCAEPLAMAAPADVSVSPPTPPKQKRFAA